jgi:lipopolysaccharide/colanic/teichoic acid biosynthesis glycosyltransferase
MSCSSELLSSSANTEQQLSTWNHSPGKRVFDLLLAGILLSLFSPLMLVVAAIVKLTSKGPVFYRQYRVSENGNQFQLIKFRTMEHEGQPRGPNVTSAGDPRITTSGRILRKWKLDELPQLINVLRGEMSFVGPRPDVSEYLAFLNPEQQRVLCLRPGMTGSATLYYRNEEHLLSKIPASQLKHFYCTQLLTEKVRMDLAYAENASFISDITILLQTAKAILAPPSSTALE